MGWVTGIQRQSQPLFGPGGLRAALLSACALDAMAGGRRAPGVKKACEQRRPTCSTSQHSRPQARPNATNSSLQSSGDLDRLGGWNKGRRRDAV